MFTQRAALLGFVAFCFYLIAVVNSLSGFFFALTWLSMGLLGASLGVALLSLVGLDCRLEITRSRGAAPLGTGDGASAADGAGALVAMAISNSGTLNKTNVVLELRVRDARKQSQSLRFLLEALPSGGAIESVLPLVGLRRGTYQLEEARLVGSDVLGLFRTQKKLAQDEQNARAIIIGPPVLKSEVVLQGGSNGFLAGRQRAILTRQGDEIRGTRPYAPGDDLRHVHWKSSARAGELVVKEWEHTGQSRVLVIWDGAAQTAWGTGEFDSLEWGLILSASLCHALLSSGIPCDFARLNANPASVGVRALIGGELPTDLTDVLSGAEANRATSLEGALHHLPRFGKDAGSKILLVSASLGSDVVRATKMLRAQGSMVQIYLIDAATVATRSGDARFWARPAKLSVIKLPAQSDGDKSIAISSASFKTQASKLREAGAVVVSVRADESQSAETTLRAALRMGAQGPGLGADHA